jgi:hypothetical protein
MPTSIFVDCTESRKDHGNIAVDEVNRVPIACKCFRIDELYVNWTQGQLMMSNQLITNATVRGEFPGLMYKCHVSFRFTVKCD